MHTIKPQLMFIYLLYFLLMLTQSGFVSEFSKDSNLTSVISNKEVFKKEIEATEKILANPCLNIQYSDSDSDSDDSKKTYIDIEQNLYNNQHFLPYCNYRRLLGNTQIKSPSQTVRVLSLDGGGIRGLITACMLERLEQRLEKPISEIFHLVIGSSTGSILTTLLTTKNPSNNKPYSAHEIGRMVNEKKHEIFSKNFWTLNGLIGPKYDSQSTYKLYDSFVHNQLISESLCPTAIVAYNTETQRIDTLTSFGDKKIYKKDAVLASTAIPGGFNPVQLKAKSLIDDSEKTYSYLDGGLGAFDPSLLGFKTASEVYKDANRIILVSLGTGFVRSPKSHQSLMNMSGLYWMINLANTIWNGYVFSEEQNMSTLVENFRTNGGHYWRLNPEIPEHFSVPDNISDQNISELKRITYAYLDSNEGQLILDNIISDLRQSFDNLKLYKQY